MPDNVSRTSEIAREDLERVPFILLAWLRMEQPEDDSYALFPPAAPASLDPWSLYTEPPCDSALTSPSRS